MKHNRRKASSQEYIRDLKKLKFSEFWSKIESILLKQFIRANPEDAERKK